MPTEPMISFACSLNRDVRNYLDPVTGKLSYSEDDPSSKERFDLGARSFNRDWIGGHYTFSDIAKAVKSGWALTGSVLEGNIRQEGSQILCIQLVILDVDGIGDKANKLPPPPVEDFLKTSVAKHAGLVYHSASSTIDHNRYRVVFGLPTALTDPDFATFITRKLAERVPGCDVPASHAKQLYFGCHPNPGVAEGRKPLEPVAKLDSSAVLPVAFVDSCYAEYERDLRKKLEAAAQLDNVLQGKQAVDKQQAKVYLSDIVNAETRKHIRDLTDQEIAAIDVDDLKASLDRSNALWKVIQEVVGWANFLDKEGVSYWPSARDLIERAARNLYPEEYESGRHLDKMKRVIGRNDLNQCFPSVAYYGVHSAYAQICRKWPDFERIIEIKYPSLLASVKEELQGSHANISITKVNTDALSRILSYSVNVGSSLSADFLDEENEENEQDDNSTFTQSSYCTEEGDGGSNNPPPRNRRTSDYFDDPDFYSDPGDAGDDYYSDSSFDSISDSGYTDSDSCGDPSASARRAKRKQRQQAVREEQKTKESSSVKAKKSFVTSISSYVDFLVFDWGLGQTFDPKEATIYDDFFIEHIEKNFISTGRLRFNTRERLTELDGFPVPEGSAEMAIRRLGWKPCRRDMVEAVISSYSRLNTYDPVVQFIKECRSNDNYEPVDINRLASRFIFGDEPSANVSEFEVLKANITFRILVMGLLRRALEPGCKFDACPVLLAESQGVNKSTFLESLVGSDFYGEFAGRELNKDTIMQAMRYWLLEIPEIDRFFGRNNDSDLKAFISGKSRYERLPYERKHTMLEWNFVLCGSTNVYNLFTDSTGNRRYPVIALPKGFVLTPLTENERIDLWCSAVRYYDQLEDTVTGWLPSREELSAMDLINTREHYKFTPHYDLIHAYLTVNFEKYSVEGIAYSQLIDKIFRADRIQALDQKLSSEVPKILRVLGWHRDESSRTIKDGTRRRARFWYPSDDFTPLEIDLAKAILTAANLTYMPEASENIPEF